MATDPTKPTPRRQNALSRKSGGTLVFLGVSLLVTLRAASEWAMMNEHGPDAQMAIWLMFMLLQVAFWLVSGLVAAALLVMAWHHRWSFRAALALLLGWCVAIGWSSWEFQRARLALADAQNPSVSPARLRQLMDFSGIQAGYELDNRIAANPKTPPEILRMLYARRQLGTLMILARRPNVPEDILQEMVDHDSENQWIRRSLKGNPNLPETMHQKLDPQEQPVTQ